jgi:spore coat polysaccharide biosynthesis protein SpsF
MGSTRLPGKVLKDLAGKTVLARVIERLRSCRLLDEVLVATTDSPADDAIVEECGRCAVPSFRGSEQDVLDRYYQAAQQAKADVVVRVTSDCPLIDAGITDKTIQAFLDSRTQYASNSLVRGYPRGLDTEVMSFAALESAWRQARHAYERTHVTPYIYEHPAEFKLLSVAADADYSHHRWTVDTAEDLEFVRSIFARLGENPNFTWRDVLDLLAREPQLVEINRAVPQKALQEG